MPRQRPPATAWTAGPAHWYAGAFWGVATGAVLIACAYWMAQGWGFGVAAVLAVLIFSLFISWKATKSAIRGSLRWDGEVWHLCGPTGTVPMQIHLVLDFQRVMLLRGNCDTGPTSWLWLESTSMSPQWLAFRRAIVSPDVKASGDDANLLR